MQKPSPELIEKSINTIRFLTTDAVQKANSGHPGLPMGMAAAAYTLWMRHLRFNPANPQWFDRDRFVLSGGHGSMLLYSLLYLSGYDLSLDEIKDFRQWESKTPGHPEFWITPGVEVTTGPLGQGFANGVGMAIAEAHLASIFNKGDHEIIDHYTYAIVTDGDLMEGISSEAASLAGHLKLSKLIYLYDDNHISIDGDTDKAFTENRTARFEAYGWHVQQIHDGNDIEAVDEAINIAKSDPRPSLIAIRTQIGYGLPTKAGTGSAHGEPPGEEELEGAKDNLGWPHQPRFLVPDDVKAHFETALEKGDQLESQWKSDLNDYRDAYPDLATELKRMINRELPDGWEEKLPSFDPDLKGMATRKASGTTINAIAGILPELFGGSADLTPSNKTWIDGKPSFQAYTPEGRNFHFGVREHAMQGIVNGIAVHSGLIPYGGTFLVFSDYLRPSLRLAALSGYASITVFTHDSIGLGEDGPTHQPIEHLASLRAIPNLVTIRPGDANEVAYAWKVAIERRRGPTIFALSRQNIRIVDRQVYAPASNLENGAYVLKDFGDSDPEIILMASGSEVALIVGAGERLAEEGVNVRLVSFPSWELFEAQDQAYKDSVFPPQIRKRLAVEAGVSQGWMKYTGAEGDMISVEKFGVSAPYQVIFEEYGFTIENVYQHARALIEA